MPKKIDRLLFAMLLAAIFNTQAHADSQDSVTFSVGLGAMHDSNLFRQSNGNEQQFDFHIESFLLT